MTNTLPQTETPAVPAPYTNWRPPLVWTALVTLVEPDHVLLRDFGGHAVLLPGGPVHDGQTPMEAAQETLQGPGSGHMILRPALTDQRQLARRKVIVHTFVTLPITRGRADELNPRDGRSSPLIVPAGKRWACSPSAWA